MGADTVTWKLAVTTVALVPVTDTVYAPARVSVTELPVTAVPLTVNVTV